MIEVLNIQAVNKGSLLAKCDVRIIPWKLTMHDVKVFEKGANRWIGMPSRDYVDNFGEKKYIEHLSFDDEGTKSRFRAQIMGAIDKYLSSNPEMKPEEVITEDSEFPF